MKVTLGECPGGRADNDYRRDWVAVVNRDDRIIMAINGAHACFPRARPSDANKVISPLAHLKEGGKVF